MAPAATGIVTIHTLTFPHTQRPTPFPCPWRTNGQTVMLSHHTRLMD